jgi:preprotein translocase subunit SecD
VYHPRPMRRGAPWLILIIGLLALLVDFFPGLRVPSFNRETGDRVLETKLGLDLQGGLRLEYLVEPVTQDNGETARPSAASLDVIRGIIEARVNRTGVAEPLVIAQGSDRIVVEMPGVSDIEQIRALVGQTGKLYFVPLGQQRVQEGQVLDLKVNPPLFDGTEVSSATIGTDQQGRRAVDFTLKSNGAKLFEDYTGGHIGDIFAIVLDGKIISAPVIQNRIPGGRVQITQNSTIGGYPLKDAQNLVTVLEFGSLPFPIRELANTSVDPTLGAAFLHQSLFAGFVAIALVVAFMLIHYRLPGLIASGALIYYALVVYALFRLVPVTLTLAGIAGFVLSVGMAVDANILIFERTKEELRVGKSLPAAIEAGFNRAWNSILDSNVSSLITALILFMFGSSVIRGFGLVLILGVLVSMFTAITVTRTVLRFVVERDQWRKAWLYGVTDAEFVARPATRPGSLRREARGRA